MLHDAMEVLVAVSAITAAGLSAYNSAKIHRVHLTLNSRLTAMIEEVRAAAHAKGLKEGREE